MLDKRTSRFLFILAKICSDGSYKIIDKAELAKESRAKDVLAMDQMLRYLQDNEMIDLKYSDETVYCLTVLPKGRVVVESTRKKNRGNKQFSSKLIAGVIIGCFFASMLGAAIGVFLFGWLF